MKEKKIPRGIKILSVLSFVGSILFFILALGFLLTGNYIAQDPTASDLVIPQEYVEEVGDVEELLILFRVFGMVFLFIAVLYAILGWGVWQGKNWARLAFLIVSVFFFVSSLFNMYGSVVVGDILSILLLLCLLSLHGAIIWYLLRKEIISFFTSKKD